MESNCINLHILVLDTILEFSNLIQKFPLDTIPFSLYSFRSHSTLDLIPPLCNLPCQIFRADSNKPYSFFRSSSTLYNLR